MGQDSSRFPHGEDYFADVFAPLQDGVGLLLSLIHIFLNHKYTDLSEPRYGVAVLNDCKYGISACGGQLRLSLHKGGMRPDFRGDKGMHYCEYGFLPHRCV